MGEHLATPWHVDPFTATVYASDVPKGPARVADMRGWGYLTGHGHGALGLSQDEAIDIQRANAAFIVMACNSYDDLVKALQACAEAKMPGEARRIAREALTAHVGDPDGR